MTICRPSSVVVCTSVRRRPSTPLNNFSSETPMPIFFTLHVEPVVKGFWGGGQNVFKLSRSVNQAGRHNYRYMVKTFKNRLLQNQESFGAESSYVASRNQVLPSSRFTVE